MSAALEHNLRQLLTRALPADGPSPEFVRRVAEAVDARLEARRPTAQRSRAWGALAACAAAALALVGAWPWLVGGGQHPPGEPTAYATVDAAWRAGEAAVARVAPGAPFTALAALREAQGAEFAALGWVEVATSPTGLEATPLGATLRLAPGTRIVFAQRAPGAPELALCAGRVEGVATLGRLRVTAHDDLDPSGAPLWVWPVLELERVAWAERSGPGAAASAGPAGPSSASSASSTPWIRVGTDAGVRWLRPIDARAVPVLEPGPDAARAAVPSAPDPAVVSPSQPEPPSAAPPGRAVQVTDAVTSAPIAQFRLWTKREVQVPEVATPTLTEVTDATGQAWITAPAGRRLTVVVEAAGYAPWRAAGVVAGVIDGVVEGSAPLTVRLERGVALVGAIHDRATSAPVEGALVLVETALPQDVIHVHGVDLAPLPMHAARTDSAGRYRIEHAPLGALFLRASCVGYAPEWSTGLVLTRPLGATPDSEVVVDAPPIALGVGGVVAGRVERPGGGAFEGAEIILSTMVSNVSAADSGSEAGRARARVMTFGHAVTDADGAYRIEDLPAGLFVALNLGDLTLGASWPRIQQATVEVERTTRVDFLARALGAELVGVLRDAEGRGLDAVELSLYELGSGAWQATRTGGDGSFAFLDVAPGDWALCRAEGGFEDQQVLQRVEVPAPAAGLRVPLEVQLPRGAIELVVAGPDGGPVAVGRAVLERERAPGQFVFHALRRLQSDGKVRIDALPAGRYRATLVGGARGLGHLRLGVLSLQEGMTHFERCALPPGGGLLVRASTDDGAKPESSFVFVTDSAGEELLLTLDTRTDAAGERRFPCLAPGTYRIRLQAPDGRTASATCEVRQGLETALDVTLR